MERDCGLVGTEGTLDIYDPQLSWTVKAIDLDNDNFLNINELLAYFFFRKFAACNKDTEHAQAWLDRDTF